MRNMLQVKLMCQDMHKQTRTFYEEPENWQEVTDTVTEQYERTEGIPLDENLQRLHKPMCTVCGATLHIIKVIPWIDEDVKED